MKQRLLVISLLITGLTVTTVIAQTNSNMDLLGGDNTVFDDSEEAFTNPLPLLTTAELELFEEGDEAFERVWDNRDGLGPIFNAVSCESCHVEDGRGRPPAFTGETGTGLLLRLSNTEQTADGFTFPDIIYGGQFQDDSGRNTESEGTIAISYQEINGTYADGTPYTLMQPIYSLTDLNYGEVHGLTTLSPRLAGQMIGLGLLEAIPEETLLALSDPDDADGDGISGRLNMVWDIMSGTFSVGRFGWKANQPNLLQQSAAAFNGDIGITTSLFPDQPCTDVQDCVDAVRNGRGNRNNNRNNNANQVEVDDEELELVTFYSSTLAVPAQRNADDPQVIQGQALFESANCSSCHVETIQTGTHETIPALSNQTIHPYTDLLLHDMGEGLADGQVDFQASGTEWRTPALWGIGLLEEVNGYAFYLHDGRASTLEEAIIWHGGEAEASRDAFLNMNADERDALIAFLQSL
ncbi:MAG: di-heme oxidoredictase family protein [Phototrophicaceae bacterium]